MAKVEVVERVPAKAKPKMTARVKHQLQQHREDSKPSNQSRKSTVSICSHEKTRSSPTICFRFQKHACFDSGKCGREHICIGLWQSRCPLTNDCCCLESAVSTIPDIEIEDVLFSQQVNLSHGGFRVLLVSSCRKHEDEFLSAWELFQSRLKRPSPLQVIFDDSSDDLVSFLDLLDRVTSGFFQLSCVLLPASTWSRARHSELPGQLPLRLIKKESFAAGKQKRLFIARLANSFSCS